MSLSCLIYLIICDYEILWENRGAVGLLRSAQLDLCRWDKNQLQNIECGWARPSELIPSTDPIGGNPIGGILWFLEKINNDPIGGTSKIINCQIFFSHMIMSSRFYIRKVLDFHIIMYRYCPFEMLFSVKAQFLF